MLIYFCFQHPTKSTALKKTLNTKSQKPFTRRPGIQSQSEHPRWHLVQWDVDKLFVQHSGEGRHTAQNLVRHKWHQERSSVAVNLLKIHIGSSVKHLHSSWSVSEFTLHFQHSVWTLVFAQELLKQLEVTGTSVRDYNLEEPDIFTQKGDRTSEATHNTQTMLVTVAFNPRSPCFWPTWSSGRCPMAGGWNETSPKLSSNPNHPVILWLTGWWVGSSK